MTTKAPTPTTSWPEFDGTLKSANQIAAALAARKPPEPAVSTKAGFALIGIELCAAEWFWNLADPMIFCLGMACTVPLIWSSHRHRH
jgi:hypothetical protein